MGCFFHRSIVSHRRTVEVYRTATRQTIMYQVSFGLQKGEKSKLIVLLRLCMYIYTHIHTPCTPSKSVRIRQVSCRCFASDNLELHKRKEKRERKKYIFICRSVREVSHCNNFGFAWATEKLSTHIAQIKWNISARTCKHSCLSASFLDESLSLRSQRSS